MPTTTLDRPPDGAGADTGTIRPFAAPDAGAVADLLVRAFQGTDEPASAAMAAYLIELYLDAPWFDPELAARVLVRADGRIVGFIGVSALPMTLDGRPIRAAVLSSLAVDPRVGDPMIGPRLLRDVRAGPQDAMLNDRSNPVAVTLLRSLGAETIRDYGYDWIRSLRPAGFALEMLASRFGAARLLAPLARPLDSRALRAARAADERRWTAPGRSRSAEALTDRPAGTDELLELVPKLLERFTLRPDWTASALATVLADAARKSDLGTYSARLVGTPDGRPLGLYLIHVQPHRHASVLQLMSTPGREGVVLDRAIAYATDCGAVAIRGRAQPEFLDALAERRVVLVPHLATVVHARDKTVLEAFRNGTAFFTGLAGENWMRLNGDRF